jgi:hypothetical protein
MNFPGNGMRITGETLSPAPTQEFIQMQHAVLARLQTLPPQRQQEFFAAYDSTQLIPYSEELWPDRAAYEAYCNEWKKIELKAQLNKKEAQLLLEEKMKKCTPSEARFLKTYFKDANSPKVIEESIEAAHTAYKKIQSEKRAVLQESVKQEITNKPSLVVTESAETETKEQNMATEINTEEPNFITIDGVYNLNGINGALTNINGNTTLTIE